MLVEVEEVVLVVQAPHLWEEDEEGVFHNNNHVCGIIVITCITQVKCLLSLE